MAWRPHGRSRASRTQLNRSRSPILTLSTTDCGRSPGLRLSAALANRRERLSTGLLLGSYLNTCPTLHSLDHLGKIRIDAFGRNRHCKQLTHRGPDNHGHAKRLSFLQTEANV